MELVFSFFSETMINSMVSKIMYTADVIYDPTQVMVDDVERTIFITWSSYNWRGMVLKIKLDYEGFDKGLDNTNVIIYFDLSSLDI